MHKLQHQSVHISYITNWSVRCAGYCHYDHDEEIMFMSVMMELHETMKTTKPCKYDEIVMK